MKTRILYKRYPIILSRVLPSSHCRTRLPLYRLHSTQPPPPTKQKVKWYKYLFKSLNKSTELNGSWEETTIDSSDAWDQTARRLKEMLVLAKAEPANINLQEIRFLVVTLVDQSPKKVIDLKYVPLVEMAYSLLHEPKSNLPLLTTSEIQAVFRAIVRNEDLQDLFRRRSVITKLYSALYSKELRLCDQEYLENGILFYRFLRWNEKILESRKLLEALTRQYPLNENSILRLVEALRSTQADIDAVDHLMLNLGGLQPSEQVSNEIITLCGDIARSGFRQVDKYEEFIEKHIFDNCSKVTAETVVILLDTCLALDAKVGKQVVERIALPNIDKFHFPEEEAGLQYCELVLTSFVKFRIDDLSQGQKIADKIVAYPNSLYRKETLDKLVQWTVFKSDNLNDLKQILDTMCSEGSEEDEILPNETTLNCAIEAAHFRDNSYVKSMIDYFKQQYEVDRDVGTFALLIDRCLASNDIRQAEDLFEASLLEGSQWNKSKLDSLYRLLEQLCFSEPDTFHVFAIFKKIKMFTVNVGYNAQVAMVRMFLKGDYIGDIGRFLEDEIASVRPGKDIDDVADDDDTNVSNTRYDIPRQEMPEIYDAMYDYIMTSTDYKQVWLLYGYLNRFFKVPYDSYYNVMVRFCEIGRPDAAFITFKYLRARTKSEGFPPPSREMYVLLFNEFGKSLYEEGVAGMHTCFKMDLRIEAEVPIINAILGAYTNLQDDYKVQETWNVLNSYPVGMGINEESVTIMLKHLTRASINDVERFWLEYPGKYGVERSAQSIRQYVVANCYHGYYMRALEIVKTMHEHYGIAPTKDIIEALHTWTLKESRKQQVENWVIENHSNMWKELQAEGAIKALPSQEQGLV